MLKPFTESDYAAFYRALWQHSDVLDGKPERQPPAYRQGSNMLSYLLSLSDFERRQQQENDYETITAMIEKRARLLEKFFRLWGDFSVPDWRIKPKIAEWRILMFGGEELAAMFITASEDKQLAMIHAVIADDGLFTPKGAWMPL